MTWAPDPAAFLADLQAKPEALASFAEAVASDPWPVDPGAVRRVILIGMGSSRFAALMSATRLRAHGIDAVAEYASAEAAHPGGPGTVAVGISAGGATPETVSALERHAAAGSATVGLTNVAGSAVGEAASHEVALFAGREGGGVACRTYQHTVLRLLQLEAQITGTRSGEVATLARRAAEASAVLIERVDASVAAELTEAGSLFVVAPNERLGNAEQGALMFREGPRLPADACETGDWLHVDVYLTSPLDYRALLFTGSRFDDDVMAWMRDRDARVVAVGAGAPPGATLVRYPGDDDPDVALVTEVLVAELAAARRWLEG
jgi:fructoselysine-6-P-deglycase FrlB-like protein